jgi:hypothetical protein
MLACMSLSHGGTNWNSKKMPRGLGCSHAKLVNVGIIADPCKILPDAPTQRNILYVGVLVTEVMRTAYVKAGKRRQTTEDSEPRSRLA